VIIDHIDFVRLGGVMMAAGLGGDLAVNPAEPVGPVVAQVRCTLREHSPGIALTRHSSPRQSWR
jgi:hypothetical protein